MRVPSELRGRLRALLSREREDRELDEELAFHLEMAIEDNLRRGMSSEEARRQARLRLGGLVQTREAVRDARGVRWFDDLARDARLAARRLAREPGYTVPTVATLALGVGVTVAVFAMVNAIVFRPLPYHESDRLVSVGHLAIGSPLPMTGQSTGTFLHYRDGNRVFEEFGVYQERIYTISEPGEPAQVRAAEVSPGLLRVLGAIPQVGRLPVAADVEFGVRTGVLISHDLWVQRFGADPDIVGRTIEVDRRREVVVGVAQPGFGFPHPETRLWSIAPDEELFARYGPRAGLRGLAMSGVGRLRPGVSIEEAERDLDRLIHTLPDAYPDVTAERIEQLGLRAMIVPLSDVVIGDVRAALLLLLATAGFLLLITWVNAINLTLVRAERLRKETALQRALGAVEGRLTCRFLCEGMLLTIFGGAIGLALAYVGIELRFGFRSAQIPRLGEVALDGAAVGLALGLSLVTAAVLTVVALGSARRSRLAGVLTGTIGRMTASRREQAVRRLLVAVQIGLAVTLLIGSALMAQSFWRLKQVELGFDPEGGLTFFLPVPPNAYSNYHASARIHHEVLRRIRTLPGVDAVAAANISAFPLTPVPGYYMARIAADGQTVAGNTDAPYALFAFATPDYFRTMGIPLLRGRTFEDGDTGRENHGVILSQSLARELFGATEPVGRRVRWATTTEFPDYTVVGVVGDVPSRSLLDGPSKVIYFPNIHPPRADTVTGVVHIYVPSDEMYVVRTSVPPASLVSAIRRSIDEVDPKLVMTRVGTLDGLVADSMARPRLTMLLLLVGAGTALLLGLIGIYGVLSYTVGRRTTELGIRIALGAEPRGMVRLIVRQGAFLAGGGIAVGLVMAFALTRFLGSMLYEVSPSDPGAFAGTAALIFAIALVASWLPARRAGRVDPARALRLE